jgi:3-hydroxyisobutyrate dehydrogenase-like beta-hydroxyacid dehydrogenase
MAENIRKRGFALTVWNRSPARAEPLAAAGAVVADSPAHAAADADVVISMLSDPKALDAVWRDALTGLRAGAIAVDMSTVDPASASRLSSEVAARGAAFLDAPVSGTFKPAVEGKLLIMAGGDATDLERARPVLESMGRVVHMGSVGQGMATKLVLNGLGAHMMTGFCALMTLGVRQGLDAHRLLEVIQGGAFSSPLFGSKGPRIFARDFTADFKLSLMLKDQDLVLGTAAELGYPMPSLEAIRDILISAVNADLGEGDLSGLVRLFETWAGVTVA